MPSIHPGMFKPSMVDVNEFELIEAAPVHDELERHGLTIEQVLNKYPNVTQFKVRDWIKGSVGDVNNKPRRIHFIDNDGNGFTLLDKCCVSKINEYVNYNEGMYTSFLD
jgi:hypothetical protein